MTIKIIILIIILYVCIRTIYLYYKRKLQEIEFRILKLEQRIEEYRLLNKNNLSDLYKYISWTDENINVLNDAVIKLKKKVKK